MTHHFLFVRQPHLEKSWPFLHDRMVARLSELGTLTVLNADQAGAIHQQADLSAVDGLAQFGGRLTPACIAHAPQLRVVGALTDGTGYGLPLQALAARQIPIIESTRAWGQSVAECAFALALCALRRIPQWDQRMTLGEPLWDYSQAAQFCDAPDFVNGDLGTKHVGVIGLGQIGRRIAQWSRTFGATVIGYDPFVPQAHFEAWDVGSATMDELVEAAEIVFVAVPPTPSAENLLSRERIQRLRRGALVVVITRAHAVDMAALQARILADELAGAFDVYDVEPLPVDHPLRGRDNVVHTPHIAGRTRDANLRVADLMVDDFARVLNGQPPLGALTPEAIAVRTERVALPY